MKLIFFDRDGVINKRLFGDYVKESNQFIFNSGFFELFEKLKNDNFFTTVVTNQQGVGKKIMTEDDLISLHNFMQAELKTNTNFSFEIIKYCTSLAVEKDERRKPEIGMFAEILEELNYNYNTQNKLFTIGDSVTDIIPGNMIGSTTIFIGNKSTIDDEYKNKKLELDLIFEKYYNNGQLNSYLGEIKELNIENYYKSDLTFENINQLLLSYNDIFI